MIIFFSMALLAAILAAFAQVLLKAGANRNKHHNNLIKQYLNIHVIAGYTIFLLTTVLSVYAYRVIPIKYAIIFLPFTFVCVILFSTLFFKESLKKRQLISFSIILIGIIIYNL